MSVINAVIVGLLMGTVFGFALEKSRVFEPGMIIGQMQLRNFIMLKVFLTAVATGLIVIGIMNGVLGTKLYPKTLIYSADIIGGLLLGGAITLAGACPGTVFAQIGAGYKDSWLVLAGGLAGALTFSYLEPWLKPLLLSGGAGKITLDTLLGVPFWALALSFAAILIATLVALEKWRPWRSDLGANHDGMQN